MKQTICALLLLLATLTASAAVVRGRIVDGNGTPLDYVNVALRLKTDHAKAYGAVTDEKGFFNITDIPQAGTYELEVSFVGYKTITREVVIKAKTDQVKAGTLTLVEDATKLKEVEVVGQASQMRFDIDKKVYNVDANISAAGASATDILENIPSIDVDQDGEVSLRNSTSVEVWINGKPSGLTEDNRAQILQQMPAGSIQSVEIITNPSAKFDPEGTSGIINLILKKDREMGYYGSVNAAGSVNTNKSPGAQAGFNFNLNHKVVDFYFNAGVMWDKFAGQNYTDRYSFRSFDGGRDTLSFLNNTDSDVRSHCGLFVRTGLDFHLNDKNTLSLSGMFHYGPMNGTATNNYTFVDWPTNDTTLYAKTNNSRGGHQMFNVGLEHLYEIDEKGSELRTSLDYSRGSNKNNYNYEQYNIQGSMPEYLQAQLRNGNNQSGKFKMDYTQKFRDNMKLEAGAYCSYDDRFSPSRTWNLEGTDSLLQQYNDFRYTEWIAALYATFGAKFGGFSFSVGLRGEYTNTNVKTRDAEILKYTSTDTSYFKLYPTVFLSYDFGKGGELQANYTRRIRRPRGRQLNLFRDMSDSTNIEFGNPWLEPEIASAVELNYIKSWGDHLLSVSAYYRFSDNCIERVRFMEQGSSNVMNSTFDNVAKRQSAGLELVAKNKFAEWVNMTTTLNGYYGYLSDVYYDVYGTGVPELLSAKTNSFSWSASIMLNFLIPYGMSAQLTGRYRSSNLVAQGKSSDQYTIDFGFRKSFLDRKLNLALSIRDLLNSRKWANTTWGNNFWQYSAHMPHGTNFKLTITYNFGNQNNHKMKRRQESEQYDSGGEDYGSDMY